MIKVCIFSSKDIFQLIDEAVSGGDENGAAIELATLTTSIKTPCFYKAPCFCCSQLIGLGQNAVCLMLNHRDESAHGVILCDQCAANLPVARIYAEVKRVWPGHGFIFETDWNALVTDDDRDERVHFRETAVARDSNLLR